MAFLDAYNMMRKFEGGASNNAADRGGATLFGVSSKYWPDEYATLKKLQEVDPDAAESYAQEFYKKNFWDAVGADNLPPALQPVVFDAAVNHGVGTAKTLASVAGNDPNAFLDVRQKYMDNIVASDPSQAVFAQGWKNRIDAQRNIAQPEAPETLDTLPEGAEIIQPPDTLDALPEGAQIVQPEAPKPAPQRGVLRALADQAGQIAQGVTGGFADEIGAAIAKPGVYALKAMTGNPVSWNQASALVDRARNQENNELAAYAEDHPIITAGLQIGGGLATGNALSKLATSAVPGAMNALSRLALSSPKTASAVTGALSGGIYGAGSGEEGTRTENALKIGGLSGVLGAAAVPASNLAGRVLGKVTKRFASSGEDAVGLAAKADDAPVTASSVQAVQPSVANDIAPVPAVVRGEASPTGILPLTQGVRNKDANLLRVEENARQGLLGQRVQATQAQADEQVLPQVQKVIDSLTGVRKGSSKDILADTVQSFRSAGELVKKTVDAAYEARDTALASAIGNKKMIGPSLGKRLDEVIQDDRNKFDFKAKSNAPALDLFKQYKDIIKATKGDEIPIGELVAWRRNVTDVMKASPGTQNARLAQQLGSAFDNWLENDLSPRMIKQGAENVGELVNNARESFKSYKSLYSANTRIGESKVIENMVSHYDKSPRQFVTDVFGTKAGGSKNTAQIVSAMLDGIPETARPEVANTMFKGEMSKILEAASKTENVSLPVLRNGLKDLLGSEVYATSFSNKQRDTVLRNLVSELDQQIAQRGRKDVISPSGGAVLRGLQSVLDTAGSVPFIGGTPRAMSEGLRKVDDLAKLADDRKTFNKAVKTFTENVKKETERGKIFSPDAMGLASGATINSVSTPAPETDRRINFKFGAP